MSDLDWLEGGSEDVKREQQALAIEFAKNYEIFTDNPRGRAILEHWDKTLLRHRTPVNADIQQYAADEAVRGFINNIHVQLEMAKAE